jgi:hypothetical protein
MTAARMPVDEITWVDAWAKGREESRTFALVVIVRNYKRGDTAAQRSLGAEADLLLAERTIKDLLQQRDKLLLERPGLLAANRGLRDRLQALTARIKARVPRQLWGRIFDRDQL